MRIFLDGSCLLANKRPMELGFEATPSATSFRLVGLGNFITRQNGFLVGQFSRTMS